MLAASVFASTLGCQSRPGLLAAAAAGKGAPPTDIAEACRLADTRCSRCHPIDRVLRADIDTPELWQVYVRRMRLQPGSAIALSEEPALVRCMVYITIGPEAARSLSIQEGAP